MMGTIGDRRIGGDFTIYRHESQAVGRRSDVHADRFGEWSSLRGWEEFPTEFDDGEFAGEFALEGVDAAADLGEGHGITSDGEFLPG